MQEAWFFISKVRRMLGTTQEYQPQVQSCSTWRRGRFRGSFSPWWLSKQPWKFRLQCQPGFRVRLQLHLGSNRPKNVDWPSYTLSTHLNSKSLAPRFWLGGWENGPDRPNYPLLGFKTCSSPTISRYNSCTPDLASVYQSNFSSSSSWEMSLSKYAGNWWNPLCKDFRRFTWLSLMTFVTCQWLVFGAQLWSRGKACIAFLHFLTFLSLFLSSPLQCFCTYCWKWWQ